jgi:hypothetical protein
LIGLRDGGTARRCGCSREKDRSSIHESTFIG